MIVLDGAVGVDDEGGPAGASVVGVGGPPPGEGDGETSVGAGVTSIPVLVETGEVVSVGGAGVKRVTVASADVSLVVSGLELVVRFGRLMKQKSKEQTSMGPHRGSSAQHALIQMPQSVVGAGVAPTTVGIGVGRGDGWPVGTSVGSRVGWRVGVAVGMSVGSCVGCSVGWAVGTDVGSSVGPGVTTGGGVGAPETTVSIGDGTRVGFAVGMTVGHAVVGMEVG